MHLDVTHVCLLKGFDNDLNELTGQIDMKYPVGICKSHPKMQCFHHRPTNLHFELTRVRKLVWASSIVCSYNIIHVLILTVSRNRERLT